MKNSGFSAIELMMALAVAIILVTVGIPMLQSLIIKGNRDNASNGMLSTLNFARNEAITRNTNVIICKSTGGSACNGTTWTGGWMIYADKDRSEDFNAGDEVLEWQEALPDNFMLTTPDITGSVVYLPSGRYEGTSGGQFDLCHTDSSIEGRIIEITSTGRPRATRKDCAGP